MNNDEILTLNKISYKSGRGESISEISFSLKKGENIVIFGPEESGLHIICPLISGAEQNFTGDIFYKGRPIRNFDYVENHQYKTEIGYLQKNYGLISNMTVEENISLPLKYHSKFTTQEIEELVGKYIKELNLEHCRKFRPVNLLRAETLRTAFIRSIVLNPDLLLVENALEGQCMMNVQTFMNALKNKSLEDGISVVITTYYPRLFAEFSNKFMMLYDGRIVFEGSREELFSSDNPCLQQYINSSANGPMKIL